MVPWVNDQPLAGLRERLWQGCGKLTTACEILVFVNPQKDAEKVYLSLFLWDCTFLSFWGFLNLVSIRFSFLKAIHLFSAIAKPRLTCVSSSPAPEIPPAGSSSRALQFLRLLPWHQIMSLASISDHPLNLSHKG